MPAESKAQQRAAAMALAAKRGQMPMDQLKGASKQMVNMTTAQLEEFASGSTKKKPYKVLNRSKGQS